MIRLILPFGPAPRCDGAAMYMVNAFNRLGGVKADRVLYVPGESSETWPEADAYIDIDWAQDAFHEVAMLPCRRPAIWWCSDAHMGPAAFAWRLNRAFHSDITLCCQKNHAEAFQAAGVKNLRWLPHAAEHTCYTPYLKDYNADRMSLPPDPAAWEGRFVGIVPRYDWCFIGHINNEKRLGMLERLSKRFPGWYFGKMFFEECAKKYCMSKIVFNICQEKDINMRFFEALSTRSCLLTEWLPELEELGFRHLEHCLFYRSAEEAEALMAEYLDPSRDQARADMAERGWRKVWAGHTYRHRALSILSIVDEVFLDGASRAMLGTSATLPSPPSNAGGS